MRKDDIIEGYRKLAFGDTADAVSLLFAESVPRETLWGMDLFCVAEIKESKTGREIRFYDRMAALRELSALLMGETNPGSDRLVSALEAGARALREGNS